MATLTSAIRLQDQMTVQLTAAANAAEALVAKMERLDAVLQKASSSGVDQLASAIGQIPSATEEATAAQEEHDDAVQSTASHAGNLLTTVRNIAAAYLSMQAIKSVLETSDELVSTTARLQMMVQNFSPAGAAADQISTQTQALTNQVYAAANRSRASVSDLMDVVGRFGNNAKDAFSSTDEVVRFSELVQKQMTIAGASTQESANAILQLSQALGSGVLRGDELNSIFEQAPNLIQRIADYMGVSIGQIRSLASEGQLSADIVKNAVLSAGEEIDEQFNNMPTTFGQAMTLIQNQALQSFQPVLDRLNGALNSDAGSAALSAAFNGLAAAANVVMDAVSTLGNAIQWVQQNSAVLEPIAWGLVAAFTAYATVAGICAAAEGISAAAKGIHAAATSMATGATLAETAAQYGLNAALAACPITWIVAGIIAAVAALIAFGTWAATSAGIANSALGTVAGTVMVVVAFVINLLRGIMSYIVNILASVFNVFSNFAAAFSVVFNNPVIAIETLFLSLLRFILDIVGAAAAAIDAVFGSNLADAVNGFQSKLQMKIDEKIESAGGKAPNTILSENVAGHSSYADAWNSGAEWGDNIANKVKGLFTTSSVAGDIGNLGDYTQQTSANTAATAGNTGSINDKLDDTEEDIAYLCDIAERDAINRFTTASINIDMTNNNTVNSGMDLDGMIDGLAAQLNSSMEQIAEGSHVA